MPFPPLHQGGSASSIGDFARFGVVTVSDRASDGRYEDLSGPAVVQFFEEAIELRCGLCLVESTTPWTKVGGTVPLHPGRAARH